VATEGNQSSSQIPRTNYARNKVIHLMAQVERAMEQLAQTHRELKAWVDQEPVVIEESPVTIQAVVPEDASRLDLDPQCDHLWRLERRDAWGTYYACTKCDGQVADLISDYPSINAWLNREPWKTSD